MRFRRNPIFLGILQVVIGSALYACSEDDEDGGLDPNASAGASTSTGGKGGSSGSSNSTAGKSSSTGGSTATGGSGNTTGGPVEACPGLPFESSGGAGGGAAGGGDGEACTGISYEAESVDVDMFIMMDRSMSMGYVIEGTDMTRWEALRAAVQEFVQSPNAAEIGGGIGFFSISGIGDDSLDCSAADYAEPVVAIAPLSESGDALVAAIDDISPGGLTPTIPALQGAISYAKGWAEEHPDKATVVVLVTDGYPTQCGNSPDQVSAAAALGYDEAPHVRTYVIGVGETARFNLDGYARAGGTREAYLTDEGDVSGTFVTALNNITNSQIACEYTIPTPPDSNTQIDYDKVQIVYTPQDGDAEEVPFIDALGSCAKNENGGWYYNNPDNPTRIIVCPCTCERFAAGRVDVRLGCEPRIGLR